MAFPRPPTPTSPRRRRRLTAALLLAVITPAVAAGCAHRGTGSGPVTILTNWFPQAELGGYWQAAAAQPAAGGKERPLKVLPGGPGIQTIPQVAAGKAVFGVATGADDLLVARKQGLPIVAVFAPFRANITCLTAHAGTGLRTFADLSGRRVAKVQSRPWWEYIKRHYKLNGVQEINYTGSLAAFTKDRSLVQQCYVTSEPYYLQRDKVPVTTLSISDQGGYAAYSNVLFTTEDTIKRDPGLVRSVVARVARGWTGFGTDPAPGRQAILAANKDADGGVIDYAVRTMRAGKWTTSPAGSMSAAQWQKIRDQVAEAGLIPTNTDVKGAFTTQFLPSS
ncbi:ABC transporter substrate-binding protein [Actinomadura barringtoniae]|uniref:ABC transporter substrate-binding protein n=1 Tax=Actinomadura barringtoniae TaxID=1427535 RepID=A0A939PVT0_9ACTN|nr:ABC transporter substrate-binding protein [Actinomadura barringtoniae]MBO2455746.1 ABC transporter substrate-binding protein [Actinomadura barringtoniae]